MARIAGTPAEPGGLPLMREAVVKVGMRPPHPGRFIREEILEELGLSIGKAAQVLGVRRATLSDLVNGHASLSPEMGLRSRRRSGSRWTPCSACRPGTTATRCANEPGRSKSNATSL